MECMSDPILPHGELPPIPDGCGILPVAENRIARCPHPELLDVVPEQFAQPAPNSTPATVLDDAMEQAYRRVLARAFAIASCALFFAAVLALSLVDSPIMQQGVLDRLFVNRVLIRAVFLAQVLVAAISSRYVEKLAILPAAVLLFGYAAFTALEFSLLISPVTLAIVFFCAALLYASTAAWGYARGADLARPVTLVFMMLGGFAIVGIVNSLLHTSNFVWFLCSVEIVVFAALGGYYAQEIRDFYQDFDDDNAQGWKASVLGALLLLINSVNVYLLVASFLPSREDERDSSDGL
jgi:FtsH-binding integral membrane protein